MSKLGFDMVVQDVKHPDFKSVPPEDADDELLAETPADVIEILGFDPAKYEEAEKSADLAIKAPPKGHPPYNPGKDPKTGKWLPKGGGSGGLSITPAKKPTETPQPRRILREPKIITREGVSNEAAKSVLDSVQKLPTAARSMIAKVELHVNSGYQFKVGDRVFTSGGNYSSSTGRINIYNIEDISITPYRLHNMIGHEAGHAMWPLLDMRLRSQYATAVRSEKCITNYAQSYYNTGKRRQLALNENWSEWCGLIHRAHAENTNVRAVNDLRSHVARYPKQAAVVKQMYEKLGGELTW